MGYLTFSAFTMSIGTLAAYEATTIQDNTRGALVIGTAGAIVFFIGVGNLLLKALNPE